MARNKSANVPTTADIVASARALVDDGQLPDASGPIPDGYHVIVDDNDGSFAVVADTPHVAPAPLPPAPVTPAPAPAMVTLIYVTPPTPPAWDPDPAVWSERMATFTAEMAAYADRSAMAAVAAPIVATHHAGAVAYATMAAESAYRRYIGDFMPDGSPAEWTPAIVVRIDRESTPVGVVASGGRGTKSHRSALNTAAATVTDAMANRGHPAMAHIAEGDVGVIRYNGRTRAIVATGPVTARTYVFTPAPTESNPAPSPIACRSVSTAAKLAVIDMGAVAAERNGCREISWPTLGDRSINEADADYPTAPPVTVAPSGIGAAIAAADAAGSPA